jgi:hypothetical protein
MLICAYLAKKDCKTVDKFVKEIEPYYDYWPKQMQTKIDIAFATACILQGEYKNSSILLFDYSKSLSKIEHNRTVCLYNLAVALYLNNQKDDVLIILNELDKQDNPQYIKLNSALLRSQVYIDRPNPYILR